MNAQHNPEPMVPRLVSARFRVIYDGTACLHNASLYEIERYLQRANPHGTDENDCLDRAMLRLREFVRDLPHPCRSVMLSCGRAYVEIPGVDGTGSFPTRTDRLQGDRVLFVYDTARASDFPRLAIVASPVFDWYTPNPNPKGILTV